MDKELTKNIKIMIVIMIIAIIAIAIFGCNPQNRFNILIKNHPELTKTDTIMWSDTIIRWGIRIDEIK